VRLYESRGFVAEGRLREHAYRNGGHHDVLIFGLLRSQTSPATS